MYNLQLFHVFCFLCALCLRIFSFILVAPRLKILATYEAQQVPSEWSPKFLPADQLFCYTSLEYTLHACVVLENCGSFLTCLEGVYIMFVKGNSNAKRSLATMNEITQNATSAS